MKADDKGMAWLKRESDIQITTFPDFFYLGKTILHQFEGLLTDTEVQILAWTYKLGYTILFVSEMSSYWINSLWWYLNLCRFDSLDNQPVYGQLSKLHFRWVMMVLPLTSTLSTYGWALSDQLVFCSEILVGSYVWG